MTSRTTVVLVVAMTAIGAGPLSGQDRIQPSSTPVALRQVARDPSLPASMRRDIGALAAAPPQVIVAPTWRVLVAFAPTISVFASDAIVGGAIRGCERELPPGVDPRAFASSNSPWAAFDSVTADQPLVVLSITPNGGPGATCGDTLVELTSLVARGIEFRHPSFVLNNNPASAQLRFGERELAPAYVGRARVLRIRNGVAGRDTSQQLRLYVPLEEFRPDSSGRFAGAQLRIRTSGTRQDTIQIPERVLRQVWLQALPWRIDRLNAATVSAAALSIPIPDGAEVQASAAALRSGNRIDAARDAQVGMASRNADARRFSRVVVGTTLWAGGDSSASAVVMGQVVEADPCIASSPQANALVRSAVSRVRPDDGCTVRSPTGVFARGLSFPGLGQSSSGRRGRIIAYATAGVFVASGLAALRSRQVYTSYQSATTTSDAANLFSSASNYRAMATGLVATGVGLWVGSAIEAAWKQRQRNSSTRRLSTYGGAP